LGPEFNQRFLYSAIQVLCFHGIGWAAEV